MAKKKKNNKGLEAARKVLTLKFLQNFKVPPSDIPKVISEIKKLAKDGGLSWPEAHEQGLENWREKEAVKQLREIEKRTKEERKSAVAIKKSKVTSPKIQPSDDDLYKAKLQDMHLSNTDKIKEAIKTAAGKSAAGGSSVARDRADAAKLEMKNRGGRPVSDVMGGMGKQISDIPKPPKLGGLGEAVMNIKDKSVDSSIEEHVLGKIGKDGKVTALGIRDTAEEFVRKNKNLFQSGLDGDASRELLNEAISVSEDALKATPENALELLGRLNYLEKVASKAKDDKTAKLILEIIGPVHANIKNKAKFKSLLQSRVKKYIGSIPGTLLGKIPLIGGLLQEAYERSKTTKESERASAERAKTGISRGDSLRDVVDEGLSRRRRGYQEPSESDPAPIATPEPITSPAPAPVAPAPVAPAPVAPAPAPVATPAPITSPAPVTPAPVAPAPIATPEPITSPAPVAPAPVATPEPITSPAPVTPAPVATPAPISPDAQTATAPYADDETLKGESEGILASKGGSRVSDLLAGTKESTGIGEVKKNTVPNILTNIHKEIIKISDLLHEQFDPEEDALKDRESSLEGGKAGISGMLKKLIKGKEGASGEAEGGGIMGKITSVVSGIIGLKTGTSLLGRSFGAAKTIVSGGGLKAAGKTFLGMGTKSAGGAIGAAGAGGAAGAAGAGGVAGAAGAGGAAGAAGAGGAVGAGAGAGGGGGGMFSNLLKSVKSAGSSVVSGAKSAANMAKGLANPLQYLKANKGIILGSLKKLPLIGSIIETAIGAFNISAIKNDPALTAEEKKEAIGKEIASRFGSLAGGVLGGAVLSPIPVVGTILGGIAGAMGGQWIGGKIADMIGPKGIYDFASSIPGIGNLISVPEDAMSNPMAPNDAMKLKEHQENKQLLNNASVKEGTLSLGGDPASENPQGSFSMAPTNVGSLSPSPNTTVGELGKNLSAAQTGLANEKSAQVSPSTTINSSPKSETNTNIINNNIKTDPSTRNKDESSLRLQRGSQIY